MGYRETIAAAVRNKPGHPIHKNVKMQAHHLLSKKGVKRSGLKSELEHLGYDIDALENLVLLPCTLQGACHLGVQLHRGNHTTTADFSIDNDDDDLHGLVYHLAVKKLLKAVESAVKRGKLCDDSARKIQAKVDGVSNKILGMIAAFTLPLSSIHENFPPLPGRPGCRGRDTVPLAQDARNNCPVGRNHRGRQGQGQAAEHITHPGKPYTLRAGR
jgi:hypothetical protein